MAELPTRTLPLFPLRAVLFPGGLLRLNVFEARYLDLVSRCLRTGGGFGVVCLKQGAEVGRDAAVQFEPVGVEARLDEADAERPGLLRVRCSGLERFELRGAPRQQAQGLWEADVADWPADPLSTPGPALFDAVQALARAIRTLRMRGDLPFAEPYRLDDAGWVANRWCELLPIPLTARQQLMGLRDPTLRLSIVDGYLREHRVLR